VPLVLANFRIETMPVLTPFLTHRLDARCERRIEFGKPAAAGGPRTFRSAR